jgi:hypothetical protein
MLRRSLTRAFGLLVFALVSSPAVTFHFDIPTKDVRVSISSVASGGIASESNFIAQVGRGGKTL